MSCFCIGGVCIPYSCLIPFLLFSLQWIAAQFAKVGLLPDCVAKKLGLHSSGKKLDQSSGCCDRKSAARSGSPNDPTTNTPVSESGGGNTGVEHIDNRKRWDEIFAACNNSTLIVKFTAEWCKPCAAIQPAYASLASKHGAKGTFVTVDVDGDECDVISGELKVAMMPTFVCFARGVEAGRMSGGNSEDKLTRWVSQMCG